MTHSSSTAPGSKANDNVDPRDLDPFNVPLAQIKADNQAVYQLFAEGLLTRSGLGRALDFVNSPRQWALWSYRLLMLTGGLLLLSGIVFFFAANWQEIPPQAKLYGLQAAIATSALAALFVGLESILGRFFAISASALVGVFLAEFDYIYQTRVDSWTLFALWATVIIPWVLVSRDAVHGLLWLTIANLALFLFAMETVDGLANSYIVGFATTTLFICFFLVAQNALPGKWLARWKSAHWAEMVLLAAMTASASIVMNLVILSNKMSHLESALGWMSLIVLSWSFIRYRLQLRALVGSVIAIIAWIAVFETFLFRVFGIIQHSFDALSIFTALFLINLALLTTITRDLQKLFRKQEIGQ